jgi:hypothetical protein
VASRGRGAEPARRPVWLGDELAGRRAALLALQRGTRSAVAPGIVGAIRRIKVVLPVAILALVGALLPAAPVAADGSATISGRLANGTSGAPVPAGAQVLLRVYQGQRVAREQSVPVGPDGSFAADGLAGGTGLVYQVVATYEGVPYASVPFTLDTPDTAKQVDLTVYEATDADPGITIPRAAIILSNPDPGTRTVGAVEAVTLANPSDRTYLPSLNGPAGPMSLLRFSLPEGAGALAPGPGLETGEIIQVDRGFATDEPVPPGTKDVVFSYRFPYRGDRAAVRRLVPYPTDQLTILVPAGRLRLEGAQLQPGQPAQLGDQLYQTYSVQGLAPGQPLSFTLAHLPSRWPLGLPLDDLPWWAWCLAGVAAGGGAALTAAWALRRRGAQPNRQRQLIEALAALDEAFERGALEEREYRRRRAATKALLARLLLPEATDVPSLLEIGGRTDVGRGADLRESIQAPPAAPPAAGAGAAPAHD